MTRTGSEGFLHEGECGRAGPRLQRHWERCKEMDWNWQLGMWTASTVRALGRAACAELTLEQGREKGPGECEVLETTALSVCLGGGQWGFWPCSPVQRLIYPTAQGLSGNSVAGVTPSPGGHPEAQACKTLGLNKMPTQPPKTWSRKSSF